MAKKPEVDDYFFSLLQKLPDVPAPHGLERRIYKKLGIFYLPIYVKVFLILSMGIFSSILYFTAQSFVRFITLKMSIMTVCQFFAKIYARVIEFISFIKLAEHLNDIILTFANPFILLAIVFTASILTLLLLGLLKGREKYGMEPVKF